MNRCDNCNEICSNGEKSNKVNSLKGNFARQLSAPLSMQIEVTSSCNVSCIHCYNSWQITDRNHIHLDIEKAKIIIEQLKKAGVFHVGITGGEPLIKKDVVLFLIEQLSEHGISCSLNSNVMLLTKKLAQELKSKGLRSILTSLTSYDSKVHDQITGKEGNFNKVISGIKTALDEDIKIGVNMVLTKLNIDHVYETGNFLKELGVKSFFATKGSWPANIPNFMDYAVDKDDVILSLSDLVRLKKEQGLYVDILECYPLCLLSEIPEFAEFSRHKCTAGITSSIIGADGEVRPCTHADMSYGNIFQKNLDEIWQNMQEWRNGDLIPETCVSCEYLSKCTGGCRMEAKGTTGEINQMDPYAKPVNRKKIHLLLEQNKIKVTSLLGEKLRVSPNIIFREENDGYILSLGYANTMVTRDSGYLLKRLLKKDYFSLSELSSEIGIDEKKLNKFLFMLYKKKIIEIL
ncbi:radical SAM/SPASM domain-containing protein [Candidatus Vampirococcus lugosii]|uniref:Radical SAM additional 4Fe4S-binding SPASM domain-containing protein n=1 Tax=Candidatus Vampirococcus lugosii TaxID=2789015 RepID=A0ABS5QMC7_9BACT|nr:radical SAM protein [Candidatus Vampirococcus lugosii]MBS8122356.1 radical SAM additional 4Fe4S-binding SPASM domain-containing protein [Candidatus Vampirococcus lugosii]MBS8122360.1 radical SAM additional 4Fe4S-binding SPASM domain-containing protein [Candidatus Vampirococcus lugosii]